MQSLYFAIFVIGALLSIASIIGYLLDVQPFHLHPDYSKDPCVGGEIHCSRMNPEFNPLPVVIGTILMLVGSGLCENEKPMNLREKNE